ncbi:RING-H2 finger protein ATL54-like [Ipomoea triloba]|uniref:RING-H2 finger protein ATL54-like n=1 Tax=Ipomoea triloba TaxID=35885 RepID=UPI00125D071D|nr:RING-H2 finger protein ATL54-like [Ipomoea triloba]
MAEAVFLRRSRKLLGNDEINNTPPPPPPPPSQGSFYWPPFPQVPLPPVVYNDFPTLPPPPPKQDSDQSLILTIALPILFATSLLSCGIRLMSLRAMRRSRRRAAGAAQPPQEGGGEIYSGLMVDHPIWYIRTVGLHSSVINAIAVCKYREAEALLGKPAECAVCLNIFQAEDNLRIMPKCNHAFHVSCIDTWLKSHQNCPVCRAVIELVDVQYPGAASPRLPGTPDREQGPETRNLEPRNNVAKDENGSESPQEQVR